MSCTRSRGEEELQELQVATNDLSGGLGAPIRLPLAVIAGFPAVALAVVVSLWAEHYAALGADGQGSLP